MPKARKSLSVKISWTIDHQMLNAANENERIAIRDTNTNTNTYANNES